ncbi:hypothetical protein JD969_15575 [Planctomycetota bacterium]|nr:hypothetical protein JD969_15575 [Planctomycetota bacterium]
MTIVFGVVGMISGWMLGESISGHFALDAGSRHGDRVVIDATPEGVVIEAVEGERPSQRWEGHSRRKAEIHTNDEDHGESDQEYADGQEEMKLSARAVVAQNEDGVVMQWGMNPRHMATMSIGGLGIMLGLMTGLFVAVVDQIALSMRKKSHEPKRASGG